MGTHEECSTKLERVRSNPKRRQAQERNPEKTSRNNNRTVTLTRKAPSMPIPLA